jgi:glycosyltransferase involved in cell wall biosynthesis
LKSKILFFGPLPPIFTGQSIAFTYAIRSIERESVVIDTQRFSNKFLSFIYIQLRVFQVFIFNRIDTIYITTSRSYFGFLREALILSLAKIFNIRVVNHLHGSDFYNFYNSSWLLKKILRPLYSHISTSIVLLNEMKEQYKQFPNMNLEVVSNCYDPIYENEVIDFNAKSGILYLSNIMYSKGIMDFLDSLNIVLANCNSDVFIAGKILGDYIKTKKNTEDVFFKKLKRLNKVFNNRVKYLGVVEGNEKMKLLKKTSIFCLPTFYKTEAFPLSIIEAMVLGNAIITTNHNYLPSIVSKKNGEIVSASNVAELGKSIIGLIDNPSLSSIQKNNVDFARENYSFSNFKENIKRILA